MVIVKKPSVSVLTLLLSSSLYALPVGNPSEASLFKKGFWWDNFCCDPFDLCYKWCNAWSLRGGFYGDYVWDRYLEVDTNSDRSGGIDETELFTNAGYIALNFCNRLDMFGTVGVTQINLGSDGKTWGGPTSLQTELNFNSYFSWSVGGRATIWEWNCLSFGIEGQYFQTTPHLKSFQNEESGELVHFHDHSSTRFSEWQIGLGVSYLFQPRCSKLAVVPYLAAKWARPHLELDDFTFSDANENTYILPDLKGAKRWGVAAGMTFTLSQMMGVTVEGRWADEVGLYINGQIRY